MDNTIVICSNPEIRSILIPLLQKIFQVSLEIAEDLFDTHLKRHIDRLKKSIWFLIESPYVDKVYRSSYYAHFSSKKGEHGRDCIRLSLFEGEIVAGNFRSSEGVKMITKQFMGFIVVRPILPGILGRSVVAKEALKVCDFVALEAEYPVSVNGVKLVARGFPHASQDAEINTCAETALWTVMEHLGAIHNEYIPLLPAALVNIVKDYSPERELPSEGLSVEHISYALKKFGPGSKIFWREKFRHEEFKNMLSTYVATGLPIIVVLQGSFGAHAIVAIGHEKTTDEMIDALLVVNEVDPVSAAMLAHKGIQIFDNDDIFRRFVFMDDNRPAYQLAYLDAPTVEYWEEEWKNSKITHFIVPFHPEMHLSAKEAKSKFKTILCTPEVNIALHSSLFIRMFLTSSDSFRDHLARDPSIPKPSKDALLKKVMPSFIWVGELSTKELIKQRKGMGLFVFDATDLDALSYTHSFIAGLFQDRFLYMDYPTRKLKYSDKSFNTFNIFNNNLNGF